MLCSKPTTLHFKIWVYFKQPTLHLLNVKICWPLVPLCNPWPGALELQVRIALWVWKASKAWNSGLGHRPWQRQFSCQLLTHLFDKFVREAKTILISTASITRSSFLCTVRQENSFHTLGLRLFCTSKIGTEMGSNPRPKVSRLHKFGQTYRRANIFCYINGVTGGSIQFFMAVNSTAKVKYKPRTTARA